MATMCIFGNGNGGHVIEREGPVYNRSLWERPSGLEGPMNAFYPNAVCFKLTVTEMTINGNKSNPLTATVTVTEKFYCT